jgi:hypothetical protein
MKTWIKPWQLSEIHLIILIDLNPILLNEYSVF